MLTDVLNSLTRLPTPLLLAAAGFLAFSETGIGFGFVVPGETGVLIAATTVTTVQMFVAMSVVVWLSATAGDSFGYLVGRRYGSQARETRLVRKVGRDKWDRTGSMLRRHGVRTVIASRFLPAVRVLTPVAAGAMRMRYPRFAGASLAGALVWAVGHVALGAFAGASVKRIEEVVGTAGWIALAAVSLIAGVVLVKRRRRSARADSDPA